MGTSHGQLQHVVRWRDLCDWLVVLLWERNERHNQSQTSRTWSQVTVQSLCGTVENHDSQVEQTHSLHQWEQHTWPGLTKRRGLTHLVVVLDEATNWLFLQTIGDNHLFTIDLLVDVSVQVPNFSLLRIHVLLRLHNDQSSQDNGNGRWRNRHPRHLRAFIEHHPNHTNQHRNLWEQLENGLVHRVEDVIQVRRETWQDFTVLVRIKVTHRHTLHLTKQALTHVINWVRWHDSLNESVDEQTS